VKRGNLMSFLAWAFIGKAVEDLVPHEFQTVRRMVGAGPRLPALLSACRPTALALGLTMMDADASCVVLSTSA
jgi:hypothetical protein